MHVTLDDSFCYIQCTEKLCRGKAMQCNHFTAAKLCSAKLVAAKLCTATCRAKLCRSKALHSKALSQQSFAL